MGRWMDRCRDEGMQMLIKDYLDVARPKDERGWDQ